jgi:phospholipid/cholesterol/gamma-HCH transport system permease protein
MEINKAELYINQTDTTVSLKSLGDWVIATVAPIESELKKLLKSIKTQKEIIWDFSEAGIFDSAGMMLVIDFEDRFIQKGLQLKIVNFSGDHQKIYRLLRDNISQEKPLAAKKNYFVRAFENIGKKSLHFLTDILAFLSFVGELTIQLGYYFRHPSSIHYKAIFKYIESSALTALGIIALTSFLIGVVIAYQSAVQLERFGANIFIVDMIGISITRELSPLITAIVVAGRSGSSYTAQLGVMKLTEEIDAMKTMGFEPFRFLVLPRIIALMISMPLLIFFADVIGIFGGMVVAKAQLNISFSSFLDHLQGALSTTHYWVGIVKGPFFAWLIAAVACFRGLQVSRDTESIGHYTTASVVNAIFLVIACDALFSVILTELEI